MPVIHELDSHMADLIAAGEVVERPSSVCKELIENSIDAGATQITVEMEHGGITYLRVQDNGCGMEPEDARTAFLRHATSKIRTKEDLAAIGTLGFRGEALAAISAVSRVDLFTKQTDSLEGTHLFLEAGVIQKAESAGCPEGTTFVIRDLFYNTPARMKFLKKDFTEAGYITSVVEHAAESHPEIAFRCIRDGKTVFHSPGTGELKQAVFAVFGKEMARNLVEIAPTEQNGIRVHGFISHPHSPRANRSYQHFFVNGRFVKSRLIQAAMEEAYRNAIITGKFPYGCLCIDLPLSQVDVNVHPSKVEVKFSQEKPIFSAVYAACKNTLAADENVPEIQAKQVANKPIPATETRPAAIARASAAPTTPAAPRASATREVPPLTTTTRPVRTLTSGTRTELGALSARNTYQAVPKKETPVIRKSSFRPFVDVDEEEEEALGGAAVAQQITVPDSAEQQELQASTETIATAEQEENAAKVPTSAEASQAVPETDREKAVSTDEVLEQARPAVRVIGSCFSTYILAEDSNGLILIDKHAAHERILFNRLRRSTEMPTQMLLDPVVVDLTGEEFAAVMEQKQLVEQAGFQIEPFGRHSLAVREVPAYLDAGDVAVTVSEMAQKLLDQRSPVPDQLDDLIHMVSCKAAIKAGWETSMQELETICDQVISDPEVTCCPHGRPVMVRLTKYELDKLFKRVNQ